MIAGRAFPAPLAELGALPSPGTCYSRAVAARGALQRAWPRWSSSAMAWFPTAVTGGGEGCTESAPCRAEPRRIGTASRRRSAVVAVSRSLPPRLPISLLVRQGRAAVALGARSLRRTLVATLSAVPSPLSLKAGACGLHQRRPPSTKFVRVWRSELRCEAARQGRVLRLLLRVERRVGCTAVGCVLI